jgi:hypothetical protein
VETSETEQQMSGLRSERPPKPSFPKKTKRLKYVFTDPTHVWAHPARYRYPGEKCAVLLEGFEQDNARNPQGNIYFKTADDGTRVLYSYRDSYPIASLFTHKKKTVVLLRSGKAYSVTTAGHMSMARQASRHIETRFTVPFVMEYGRAGFFPGDAKLNVESHNNNLADYVTRINDAIEAFSKARSSRIMEWALESAASLNNDARAYAKFFNLKLPKLPKLPVLDADKLNAIKERESVRDAKRKAKLNAERAEQARIWGLENAEKIAEWKAGKPGYYHIRSEYALLRVVLDHSTLGHRSTLHIVETSQGVSVPVSGRAGAARLLTFLQACKDANRPYKANGHTEHIGNFTVQSFGPIAYDDSQNPTTAGQWLLVAGCHRILWSEVQSIADAVRIANDLDSKQEVPDTTPE